MNKRIKALLVLVVAGLGGFVLWELHTSRANERALSAHVDRLYLAGKGGVK